MVPPEEAPTITLFEKKGCHLCEAVEAEIRSVAKFRRNLTVVYIDEDPSLHDRYFLRVPVVTIGAREVFEAKMMDREARWKAQLFALLTG